MKKVQGVLNTEAGAFVGYHQFEEQELPTIRVGYSNGTDYASHSVMPLTWEAAEELYYQLDRLLWNGENK